MQRVLPDHVNGGSIRDAHFPYNVEVSQQAELHSELSAEQAAQVAHYRAHAQDVAFIRTSDNSW